MYKRQEDWGAQERRVRSPSTVNRLRVSPELACHGITANDVLFGKSGDAVDHVGTVEFRRLVDRFMPVYKTSSRREKTVIADNLIREVKEPNGRFLMIVVGDNDGLGGHWEEVAHSLARKKTAHTFRNRKRISMDTT